jgi:uncharacterized protein YbcV (DUF1398 family)
MSAPTNIVRAALSHGAAIRPRVGGFPHFAECLLQAGVRHVDVTVPTASTVYVLADTAVLKQGDTLQAVIRADQAGETTYAEFVASSWAAGVIAYQVDLDVRTCTYHGAHGEHYVETYDPVDVATSV